MNRLFKILDVMIVISIFSLVFGLMVGFVGCVLGMFGIVTMEQVGKTILAIILPGGFVSMLAGSILILVTTINLMKD